MSDFCSSQILNRKRMCVVVDKQMARTKQTVKKSVHAQFVELGKPHAGGRCTRAQWNEMQRRRDLAEQEARERLVTSSLIVATPVVEQEAPQPQQEQQPQDQLVAEAPVVPNVVESEQHQEQPHQEEQVAAEQEQPQQQEEQVAEPQVAAVEHVEVAEVAQVDTATTSTSVEQQVVLFGDDAEEDDDFLYGENGEVLLDCAPSPRSDGIYSPVSPIASPTSSSKKRSFDEIDNDIFDGFTTANNSSSASCDNDDDDNITTFAITNDHHDASEKSASQSDDDNNDDDDEEEHYQEPIRQPLKKINFFNCLLSNRISLASMVAAPAAKIAAPMQRENGEFVPAFRHTVRPCATPPRPSNNGINGVYYAERQLTSAH